MNQLNSTVNTDFNKEFLVLTFVHNCSKSLIYKIY